MPSRLNCTPLTPFETFFDIDERRFQVRGLWRLNSEASCDLFVRSIVDTDSGEEFASAFSRDILKYSTSAPSLLAAEPMLIDFATTFIEIGGLGRQPP